MYNKVDTNMNFVDREKETEKFWRENDIFKKSMENRKEGETYTFYDGPPVFPDGFFTLMTDRLRQTENHISDM